MHTSFIRILFVLRLFFVNGFIVPGHQQLGPCFLGLESSRLFLSNDNDDSLFWDNWKETRRVQDYTLLFGDFFSIIVACELLQLLDVINDAQFIKNGGWLQPIPMVPPTISILLYQRIPTLSILWILACISEENSFSYDAVKDEKVSILFALTLVLNFVSLRFLLGGLDAYIHHTDISWGLLLRDSYFVGLILPGFRFLYSQYINRYT